VSLDNGLVNGWARLPQGTFKNPFTEGEFDMRIIIVTSDAAAEVVMDETYGLRDLEIALVNRDHPELPVYAVEPKVDAPKVKGAFKSIDEKSKPPPTISTSTDIGIRKHRRVEVKILWFTIIITLSF